MSPTKPPGDEGTGGRRRGHWQPPGRAQGPPPDKAEAPARPRTAPGPRTQRLAAREPVPGALPKSAVPKGRPAREAAQPNTPPKQPAAPAQTPRLQVPGGRRGIQKEQAPAASSPLASRNRPFFSPRRPAGPRIISGGERALFWALLAAVLGMSIFLVRYRERVTAHFDAQASMIPLASAASTAPVASLHLEQADDITGAITDQPIDFPMPTDPNTRAQVVLEKLLAEYSTPGARHYLPPGPSGSRAVNAVYLEALSAHRGTLAVVDLTGSFVRRHPSGIEPETLTLLSMIATLHANLPSVTQVHFLVDGEPRPTLAGHADLLETYLAGTTIPSQAFQSAR